MVALFVVATIIVFFVIDYFVQRGAKRKAALLPATEAKTKPRFVIPRGYFIGKGHTWVELLPDGLTRVGLDDFVQKIMGHIDGIEPISVGDKVRKGDKLFSIRQGSKTLTFFAPISGKIVATNDEIRHYQDVIRKDPYKAGWVVVMEPVNLGSEIKQLSIANEAAEWLRQEIKRFRNFIAAQRVVGASAGPATAAGITLLDGGVPVNDVMEHSPQEVWSKFQYDFLTTKNHDTMANN